MSMKCFSELKNYGAESVLKREYGDMYQSIPEPGYDVTLKLDLEKWNTSDKRKTFFSLFFFFAMQKKQNLFNLLLTIN
jgi:hypothetical protein